MEKRKAKRVHLDKLSPSKMRQLEKWRALTAKEVPELVERYQRSVQALEEKSFSGEVRRAIQAFPMSPATIAEKAGVSWLLLDAFMTGDKPLTSDVLNRLIGILGLKVSSSKRATGSRKAKAG